MNKTISFVEKLTKPYYYFGQVFAYNNTMKLIQLSTSLLLIFFTQFITAQNLEGFDEMCGEYISGTVTLAMPQQVLRDTSGVILDTREITEYNTSHIKGARFVGYDYFKLKKLKDIDKNTPIYVYCSIGYRSEQIGEKLQSAGYTKVYNMYGGIFNWVNTGYTVVNKKNQPTTLVHGYNQDWGKWLNKNKCKPIID